MIQKKFGILHIPVNTFLYDLSYVETHGSASPSEERSIDALKLGTKKCLSFLCSVTHCRASLHKTNRTKKVLTGI